jgi:O-antigen/teichoic acid export membrane protein
VHPRLHDLLTPGSRLAHIAGNAGWLALDRGARMLVGLLVGIWIARHLGPERYGELGYALAVLALVQILAALGLDSVVVRNLARDPGRAPRLLGTVLALKLGSGLAGWALAVAAMALVHGASTLPLLLVALASAALLMQAGDVVDLWFQGTSQNRRSVLARLAALAAATALRVALILGDAPLAAFAAAVAFEAATLAAALAWGYRRHRAGGHWRFDAAEARRLLAECAPLMAAALAAAAYSRVDLLLVKHLLGAGAAGVFVAVTTLSGVWVVLPTVLQLALAPAVARQRSADPAAYRETLVQVFRLFFVGGLLVAVLLSLLAAPLIGLLYGPAYAAGAPVLAWHAFTNLFIALGLAHSLWIVNEGRTGVRLAGNLAAGAVSLAANAWLLPRHGLVAAGAVAVLAQFIAAVGINALIARDAFWLQLRAVSGLRLGSAR